MVYVFFRGFGAWWSTETEEHEQVSLYYRASGIFTLTTEDSLTYRYTNQLPEVSILLPGDHIDSEFERAKNIDIVGDLCSFSYSIDSPLANIDKFYFRITNCENLVIIPEEKPNERCTLLPTPYSNEFKIKEKFISEMFLTLYQASEKFWKNAIPEEKDTHPTNNQVETWLISKGFSEISARQGAVIIRPQWAAIGRRPTK